MGFQDYISEVEAAAFSGVSVSTLNRFAEAGYFKIETDSDGLRLFSKSELSSVFGLESFHPREFKLQRPSGAFNIEKPEISRKTVDVHGAKENKQAALENQIEIIRLASTAEHKDNGAGPRIMVADAPEQAGQSPAAAEARATAVEKADEGLTKAQERIAHLELELQMVKGALQSREKALEDRESLVKDLEEQRSWLKTRLERLEEKAERDQLLLLAETQTIKRLIHVTEQKRSPMRSALEWLGFLLPEPPQNSTIELKKEK